MFDSTLILTHGFQKLRVRHQVDIELRRPRLGVRLRIVNGNANFQVPKILAPEALDHMQSLGLRTPFSVSIQPRSLNPILSTTTRRPDRSGFPSAVLGVGAERLGLPSAVRGIPGVG